VSRFWGAEVLPRQPIAGGRGSATSTDRCSTRTPARWADLLPAVRETTGYESVALHAPTQWAKGGCDQEHEEIECEGQHSAQLLHHSTCRSTSLIKNRAPLGPYTRTMPRAVWWSLGGGRGLLMSELPLYCIIQRQARGPE